MTIDKRDVITIPKWLVIWLAPTVIAGIVSYGTINSWKGQYESKAVKTEQEVQRLFDQKSDRTELNILLNTLNRIENKLDTHISEK